ncbi:MAG: hypothetical protein AAGH67_15080 [Cyanobacteria bacterium P01_H01_bin.162]
MPLIRWEPFKEVDSLQREMKRLFNKLSPLRHDHFDLGAFVPAAELNETHEGEHVTFEVGYRFSSVMSA